MINEVLNPGEVGIAHWRYSVFPTRIATQEFAFPITVIKRWIGNDKVSFEIFVCIFEEASFVIPGNVGVNPTDGQIHFCQTPSGLIGFLPVNGKVADLAPMLFDEFLTLNKHAARSATGAKDPPLVRFEH